MPRFFTVVVLVAMIVCGSRVCVGAAELTAQSQAEISHLLAYMKNSGCQFNRNGTWYGVDKAVAHIEEKYKYLLDKNMISSTEDFIDKAASKSSMSGNPYLVQCGHDAPVPSDGWFKAELAKARLKKE